jgi:hypothetical protein
MRLSLSTRVGEAFKDKRSLSLPFPDIVSLARATGYPGICLRAAVVGVESPPERVAEVRAVVGEAALAVSMVTGDFHLAANDDHATDALRNIAPYLDLAEAVGCRRIRVMIQREEDIPYARRAADEAGEREVLLCHQVHIGTLFERVAGTSASRSSPPTSRPWGTTTGPSRSGGWGRASSTSTSRTGESIRRGPRSCEPARGR